MPILPHFFHDPSSTRFPSKWLSVLSVVKCVWWGTGMSGAHTFRKTSSKFIRPSMRVRGGRGRGRGRGRAGCGGDLICQVHTQFTHSYSSNDH